MSNRLLLFLVGLLLLLALGGPENMAAQTSPDDRFGMTEVFWLPEEAQDLGVGWERILFYWREIQPAGPDDWNTLHVREEWLREANAQGRTVVGLIKNTAPWASADGTEAGVPIGLYLPVDDPDNLWAKYVRRVAGYYSDHDVHHWIIWNEPEIEPGVYGFEFAGSTADYYQLLKSAYKVMKEVDPEAVIHLAGLTWWHDPSFLDGLLALAAADPESAEHDYFFDVISLHIYFRSETVQTLIEEVQTIQARYGLDKPIWINETNAPPNRDPDWPVDRPRFNIDLEQQAWYIVQALALGFASGAERISVYKLIDIHLPAGGESFGVVRPDYSRRPAYDAYKVATNCFGGFTDIALQTDPGYYHVTFVRPGSLVHVSWARTTAEKTLIVPASSESAAIVGLDHSVSDVLPEGGSYVLHLPGQRCDEECLVGGAPVLLVERLNPSSHLDRCLATGASDPGTGADARANVDASQGSQVDEELQSESINDQAATVVVPTPIASRPGANTEVVDAGTGVQDEVDHEAAMQEGSELAMVDSARISAEADGDQAAQITTPEPDDDPQYETVGLWVLAASAVVALGITLTWWRLKTSKAQ